MALLSQLSWIPKAAIPVYMVKIGPGKSQAPDMFWRLACFLFFISIFLKVSLVNEAWVTWTWMAVSFGLAYFV